MTSYCFFCDIQEKEQPILDNEHFFFRFDDFPVSEGHGEIITKKHIPSFFELKEEQLTQLHGFIKQVKAMIDEKHHPDGYNIGINEGKAAGQTQSHLHIHLIPIYTSDTPNPKGGVRNIIPGKGDYSKEVEERMPERKRYL